MNEMDEDIKSADVIIELQDGCRLLRSEEGIWAGKYGKSPAIVLGEREAEEDLIKEIRALQQKTDELQTKLSQSNNLLAYKNRDIEQLEQDRLNKQSLINWLEEQRKDDSWPYQHKHAFLIIRKEIEKEGMFNGQKEKELKNKQVVDESQVYGNDCPNGRCDL